MKLLIAASPAEATDVRLAAEEAGWATLVAENGEEGIDLARRYQFDAIIVDVVVPLCEPFEVVRRVCGLRGDTPVVVVSHICAASAAVRALRLGADDYIRSPFDEDEFTARVQAVVRRAGGTPGSVIELGEFVLDVDARQLMIGKNAVHLTGKEFDLLACLVLRRHKVLSRQAIMVALYSATDEEPDEQIIDTFLFKLRKKLADASNGHHYIETIRGQGYQFVDPMEVPAKAA
jgi:two-component system, cell cycle response regulator CtrA